ncbi:MAG: DUF455 family protein [Bacteroidota bacterium]|nr:DUF455 family protein [Bacteroidota bacterium]MDP4288404.1 DUF455 family protein [Bacteroidota bacterium]
MHWSNAPELRGTGAPLANYNFPKDLRRLGGDFTVEECQQRLLRFFLFERNMLRALAGWIIGTPEFEVKVEYGRHVFWHAEAGMKLRTRLAELRIAEETTDAFDADDIAEFFAELLHAETPAHFLAAMYGVLLPAMKLAYQEHAAHTDQVADAPTLRCIRHILFDYDDMIAWGSGAIEAYVQGGYDLSALHQWQYHTAKLLRSFGGVTAMARKGPRPGQLRSLGKAPFERSLIATRDPRFTTFDNTYEYQEADEAATLKGGIAYETEFDKTRLNLVRSQRDEIDAIETFGNVLYEIRPTATTSVPFGFDYDIAHIIWDETRHTELGHKALEALGYNPYDLLNRLLGIKVRTKMPPLYALAEINLFGEANIVQECLRYAREAYERGDDLTGRIFDFVNADERTHLAKGVYWLRHFFQTDSVQEIEQKTKTIAIERLLELGIINHEVALTISHRDLAKIIGE